MDLPLLFMASWRFIVEYEITTEAFTRRQAYKNHLRSHLRCRLSHTTDIVGMRYFGLLTYQSGFTPHKDVLSSEGY
jgi:hypothetical protein